MEGAPKRHCWECLRRCLVCDSTRPVCRRCSQSGTECPGYGEKPRRLKWLAPGRVTSHRRRPKRPTETEAAVAENEGTSQDLALSRFKMRTNACAIFEAAEYFNACIHPELLPMLGLGPNPEVYPISSALIQRADSVPDHLTLSIVCMTLSHRIHRIRSDADRRDLAKKLYRHRGDVLHSLNKDVGSENGMKSDILFASIISFLLAEIQSGPSPAWRCHLNGVRDLTRLRGGLHAISERKGMTPLIHCYVLATVLGDTTSPSSDLAMATWRPDEAKSVLDLFSVDTNPCRTLPSPLFVEIIKINCLRARVGKLNPVDRDDLTEEGYGILARITQFCRQGWVASKPTSSTADWLVLCEIHECAVALYCILSLQSVSVLPRTTDLKNFARTCATRLWQLLPQALASSMTRLSVLWPLVVLGVEAAESVQGMAMQAFVRAALLGMSHYVGSYAPRAAAAVLQRYWASGKRRWDECFDQPHLFLAQTAVDVSGISIV
ncbi:C6 zinc finger domain-containing protein [Immersiella caudata]|uniref:C6 zinc finger domain-containing protein n=1 Tax=Immersiella caudata TaxID=314043 RepID=A0AA39WK65_9PEZI|nr:C6 zinc finger domain-containing protein [Immersiella caudata]